MALNSIRKNPRRGTQLGLAFRPHGGKRRGAGRPNRSGQQAHSRRERFDGTRAPVHVTVRFAKHVWNLRSQRGFACVRHALAVERRRGELRVVHFSVQGNHLHLVVEADDQKALSRRMQGFGIRLARRLNELMNRRGRVYADRYHAHVLRTPREAARAIRYVLENHAHHVPVAKPLPDRFASSTLEAVERATSPPGDLVHAPTIWLLKSGWRRGAP